MRLDKSDARCNNQPMRISLQLIGRTAIPLCALLLAACSGGERPARRSARADAGRCGGTPEATLAGPAVREYLKLQVDPYPQRFLVAAGTDSALPEKGVLALQDKGPTYFFPADTIQRGKVREKLAEVGSFHTLLVTWKGAERVDTTAMVRLGGTYIGAASDGRAAPVRTMRFVCDSTGWRFDRADALQQS